MCLILLKIVWIAVSIGFLVFNTCYGTLQECQHSDNLSFQVDVVLGSKFELPLCWQKKDYNITFAAINSKSSVKVNSNKQNVWLASRANVSGHIGDQVMVFMINQVGVNDIKKHLVMFHPYDNWTTIHVNVTKSASHETTPALSESNVSESTISESTITESTITESTLTESTITESTITESSSINKVESVCEGDWQYIENRCVKLFQGAKWSDAVKKCQEAEAKLTNGLFNRSVYKQDRATWINKKMGAKCYLQLKKTINREGDCNASSKYFCEKNVGVDGKCESIWQQVGDKCIQYLEKQTWTRAFDNCKNISADLTNGTLDYELYSEGGIPTWINLSNGSLCSFMQINAYTEKLIPCNRTRNFFCEKSQDPPNVTHFNLQTNLQRGDIITQDLLNRYLERISVDKQATSLMFACNASGALNVTIIKDEEIKATGINSATYQQSLSQPTFCFDSGEYSCVAHNNFGVSKFSKNIQGTCKLRIESFSASTKKQSVKNLFIVEVNETGVNVQCTTNRVFGSFLKIQHKGNALADTLTTKVSYTIPHVKCGDMGQYVCKAEDVMNRKYQEETIQLAVLNCQAQPCSNIDQSKTIKAKVHDNITVSFCVIIYQEQFKQPKLYLNETMIEQTELFNRYSWSLHTYGHLNKTFNLHINDIKPGDFGVHYINIEFNGYNTSLLLDIQPEGPPLCPTNLTIHEIGTNDVILSWTPGFNGGAEQKFRIVYNKVNETSQQTREAHETSVYSLGRMYVTIDNLETNTSYEFRVTSSNRFGHQIEEPGLCDVTTTGTTRPGAVSLENKGDLHIGALAVAGAAVVVIIVALVAVVIKKRGIRLGQRKIIETKPDGNEYDGLTHVYANMSSSSKQEETNTKLIVTSEAGDHTLEGDRSSGRYVSDQGLVYVTLAHTQSIKKPPRKVSVKQEVESVEYVTIDYARTGHQQDEDLNKEETSEVKGSGDMEMVDTSSTAGSKDSSVAFDTGDANKSMEICQVDNKEDEKLLG